MRFYGVELKGKLILQKVDGLPTFDSTRDEGRLVYNESDGKIYHGTGSDWVEGVISGDLADVATSGDYSDLSGTPDLADVATSGDYSDLSGTPDLAAVATSGDYSDLSGTPPLGTQSEYDQTISTSDPSGGSDGDVGYTVE